MKRGKGRASAKERKLYRVWVQLEEESVNSGDFSDIGLPDKIFISESEEAAKAFIRGLPGWAEQGETSDYR